MTLTPVTISVTELRDALRHILEGACFRNRCYIVARAGEPMAVILGIEQYEQLVRAAGMLGRDLPAPSGRTD